MGQVGGSLGDHHPLDVLLQGAAGAVAHGASGWMMGRCGPGGALLCAMPGARKRAVSSFPAGGGSGAVVVAGDSIGRLHVLDPRMQSPVASVPVHKKGTKVCGAGLCWCGCRGMSFWHAHAS